MVNKFVLSAKRSSCPRTHWYINHSCFKSFEISLSNRCLWSVSGNLPPPLLYDSLLVPVALRFLLAQQVGPRPWLVGVFLNKREQYLNESVERKQCHSNRTSKSMLHIRSNGTLFAFIWIPPPPPPRLVRLQPISPWTPALLAPFLCPFPYPRWRFSVQIQRSLVPNTLHCRLPQYRFHTHCQLKSWMETTLNSINNFKWKLRYTALRTDFIWIVRRIHPLKPCIKIHILSSHWFQCQYLIVVVENLYYHNLLGHV